MSTQTDPEHIKDRSNYLRGTLKESLADELTGALHPDDQIVVKFHGSYQQQDRDIDQERKHQKLEPLYSFMIRVRVPGGVSTAAQWLEMDRLCDTYGNGTLKLTTRQAFQINTITKRNLKPVIKQVNDTLLDTLAACGDVNRNVMASANPWESIVHAEVHTLAKQVNTHLSPQTGAYHEIWLDKQLVAGGDKEEEPIYGKLYLPRKFKTAFAIPPQNDVDIFANDLGFIAIVENNELTGFNLTVGGGMGMTFAVLTTYPRLANVVGYLPKNKVVQVAEEVLKIQRDLGNREERKNARFKYTIDRIGIDTFKAELNKRLGWELQPVKPFTFDGNGDKYGWTEGIDQKWHLTLFVEGGRVRDTGKIRLKKALREIAKRHDGHFILTGNQNLVIAGATEQGKKHIDAILQRYGVLMPDQYTALRLNSIACASLPMCSLAFAEAERYLPSLVTKLEQTIIEAGLKNDAILIRMTGCPNGCGRPFLGEIAMVGRAPGKYNLYLGAAFDGSRLNKLYKEMVGEDEILEILKPLITSYASERQPNEHFGDYTIRKGLVKPTLEGKLFHNDIQK